MHILVALPQGGDPSAYRKTGAYFTVGVYLHTFNDVCVSHLRQNQHVSVTHAEIDVTMGQIS